MTVMSEGMEVGEMFIDSVVLRIADMRESKISRYKEVQSSFGTDGYDGPNTVSPKKYYHYHHSS